MKKVLFGIMALSMTVFAANPGNITGTDAKTGTASVPVKVLAEVIAPADALVITDEAGNIIGAEGIVLDHGIRTQADGKHETAPFRFKVKRATTTTTDNVTTTAYGPINGILTVSIDAVKAGTAAGQEINLGKVGGGADDVLPSTLKLANGGTGDTGSLANKHGYTADMGTTATEHTGEITSTVNFAGAAAGKYESGLTEDRPELVVTIAATK